MSTNSNTGSNGNRPPRLSGRDRALLILYMVGLGLAILLFTVGGALAGNVIEGGVAGRALGGGIGLSAGVLLIQRFLLGESWIECGCIAVLLCVSVITTYLMIRS